MLVTVATGHVHSWYVTHYYIIYGPEARNLNTLIWGEMAPISRSGQRKKARVGVKKLIIPPNLPYRIIHTVTF